MAANNVVHFAVHADDVERARAFYEAVFGWRFEAWGPPGFYRIHTGSSDGPGIEGALHTRHEPLEGEEERRDDPEQDERLGGPAQQVASHRTSVSRSTTSDARS